MKKVIILITLVLTVFSFTACFDDAQGASTIIVYTNQTSGGRGAQLESLVAQANFDFEVLFVELSGQNLKNRLLSEKNAPLADVVLGGGIAEHLELKDQGVTRAFTPNWLNQVDEINCDADHYFNAWAVEPLYLVYNKQYFTDNPAEVTSTKKLAPTSYEDLAANFKGKYNVFKPSSTSGTTIYASILSQYRDPAGDLGVSANGWNLLSELINNGIIDNGLWQANLAGSKYPISMTWAGAIIEIEEAYDVELGIVVPTEGVPVTVSQIALVESNHEGRINSAQEFINWWGKTETQVSWAAISGQAPANQAALELVDQRIKEISDVKFLELDWGFIAAQTSAWRQKIELDIIQ